MRAEHYGHSPKRCLCVLLPLLIAISYNIYLPSRVHYINDDLSTRQLTNSRIHRDGVIILGMHRSGTSVLAGLLSKMGLNTGGPLLPPSKDNPRGFFEREDIVIQNHILLRHQFIRYAYHTQYYDANTGLQLAMSNSSLFAYGRQALAFLNDPLNHPYLLKDPRFCITLRTWLPLIQVTPAILFIYRHPFDVALSLHRRGHELFRISKGLRLWYVYNRRAIQQSHDLCKVVTSYESLMADPKGELDRVYRELRDSCGFDIPRMISNEDITFLVNVTLQSRKPRVINEPCQVDGRSIEPPRTWMSPSEGDLLLYRKVVMAFCAMESRTAFLSTFDWDDTIRDV